MAAKEDYEVLEFDAHILCPNDDAVASFAHHLRADLVQHGFRCADRWRNYGPGRPLPEQVQAFTEKSRFVINLLCKQFLREFEHVAKTGSEGCIIVKVGPCEVPPTFQLPGALELDYTDPTQRAFVIDNVRQHLRPRTQPVELEPIYASIAPQPTTEPAGPAPVKFTCCHQDGPTSYANGHFGAHVLQSLTEEPRDADAREVLEKLTSRNLIHLVRSHLPYWCRKKDCLALAQCLNCVYPVVCKQAISYLKRLLLQTDLQKGLQNDTLKVLQKCLEALGLQEGAQKNEAIREDRSGMLHEEFLFVTMLATSLIYYQILCKDPEPRTEAVQHACEFVNVSALLQKLRQCPYKSGHVNKLKTIIREMWLQLKGWQEGNKQKATPSGIFLMVQEKQNFEVGEDGVRLAAKFPILELIALTVAVWVQACKPGSHSGFARFLQDLLARLVQKRKPHVGDSKAMFLAVVVPALVDIISQTVTGENTELATRPLDILKQLLRRGRYCSSEKQRQQVMRSVGGLILHQNASVRNKLKELSFTELRQNEQQREMYAILTRRMLDKLKQIPLLLNGAEEVDMTALSGGRLELKGTLYLELCLAVVAVPELDDIAKGDEFFENVAKEVQIAGDSQPDHIQQLKKMTTELDLMVKLKGYGNIVRLLAYEMKPMPFFYILERSPEGTLEMELIRQRQNQAFRSHQFLVDVIEQAGEVIQLCNSKGILINSINTAAFSLFPDGTKYRLKLTSLSLATDVGMDLACDVDGYVGSASERVLKGLITRFMAPETLELHEVTEKTEAYAFGCLMYQILTFNALPFDELGSIGIQKIMRKVVRTGYTLKHKRCISNELFRIILHLTMLRPDERCTLSKALQDLKAYNCPVADIDNMMEFCWVFNMDLPETMVWCDKMEKGAVKVEEEDSIVSMKNMDTTEESKPDDDLSPRVLLISPSSEDTYLCSEDVPRNWPAASGIQQLFSSGFTSTYFTELLRPFLVAEDNQFHVMSRCLQMSLTLPLPDYIRANPGLQLKEVMQILAQVGQGLNQLHQQSFVIGDLRPEFILVSATEPLQVKIASYGRVQKLDKNVFDSSQTGRTAKLKGTILDNYRYMGLETLQDGILSVGTDVFNFGVVLWAVCEWYCKLKRNPFLPYYTDPLIRMIASRKQLQSMLEDGGTLPAPHCDILPKEEQQVIDALYLLMTLCWAQERIARPSLSNVITLLLYGNGLRDDDVIGLCVGLYEDPDGQPSAVSGPHIDRRVRVTLRSRKRPHPVAEHRHVHFPVQMRRFDNIPNRKRQGMVTSLSSLGGIAGLSTDQLNCRGPGLEEDPFGAVQEEFLGLPVHPDVPVTDPGLLRESRKSRHAATSGAYLQLFDCQSFPAGARASGDASQAYQRIEHNQETLAKSIPPSKRPKANRVVPPDAASYDYEVVEEPHASSAGLYQEGYSIRRPPRAPP